MPKAIFGTCETLGALQVQQQMAWKSNDPTERVALVLGVDRT